MAASAVAVDDGKRRRGDLSGEVQRRVPSGSRTRLARSDVLEDMGEECRDFMRLMLKKDSKWLFLVTEDRLFEGVEVQWLLAHQLGLVTARKPI